LPGGITKAPEKETKITPFFGRGKLPMCVCVNVNECVCVCV